MKENFAKMCNKRQITIRLSVLILTLVLIVSCDRQKNRRGYDYIPDMVYSQAYDTYSQNPNFADSMTMRSPVIGTVPRGFIPFRYATDSASRLRAGKELLNPFQPISENLDRGKLMFTIYCMGCHGPLGNGDGHLFTSGLYTLKPRAISAHATAKLLDGQIYHTITLGFGSMQAHGAQVRPDDRWKIILYVRELQKQALKARDTVSVKPGK